MARTGKAKSGPVIWDSVSHELGHTFGMDHVVTIDQNRNTDYYSGRFVQSM